MQIISYVPVLLLFIICDVVTSRFPVRHEKLHKYEVRSDSQSVDSKSKEELFEFHGKSDAETNTSDRPKASSVSRNGTHGHSWSHAHSPTALKSSFGGSGSTRLGDRWSKPRQLKGKRRYFWDYRNLPLIRRRRFTNTSPDVGLDDEDIDAISRKYKENPSNKKLFRKDGQNQERLDFFGNPDGLQHSSNLEDKERLMETIVKLAANKEMEQSGKVQKVSPLNRIEVKSQEGRDVKDNGKKFVCKSETTENSEPTHEWNSGYGVDILNRDALESQLIFLDRPQSDSQSASPMRTWYRKPFRGYFGRFAKDIEASELKNRRQGRSDSDTTGYAESEKRKRYFRTLNRKTPGFLPMAEATPKRYRYPTKQSKYKNAIDYLRRKPFIERPQSEFQQEEPQESVELELQLVEINEAPYISENHESEEGSMETLRLSNKLPRTKEQTSATRKLKHLLRKQEASRRIQRHVAQQIAQHRKTLGQCSTC